MTSREIELTLRRPKSVRCGALKRLVHERDGVVVITDPAGQTIITTYRTT